MQPIPGLPPIVEGKYVDLGQLLPTGLQRAFERMQEGKDESAKKPKKIPITSIGEGQRALCTHVNRVPHGT